MIESGKNLILTFNGRFAALVMKQSSNHRHGFIFLSEQNPPGISRIVVQLTKKNTLSSRLQAVSGGNSLVHRYRVHQGSLTSTAAGLAGLSLITIKVVEVDAVQVVLRPPACVREA